MNLEATPEFEPKTFSYRECALPVVAEIADFDLNSTARSVGLKHFCGEVLLNLPRSWPQRTVERTWFGR